MQNHAKLAQRVCFGQVEKCWKGQGRYKWKNIEKLEGLFSYLQNSASFRCLTPYKDGIQPEVQVPPIPEPINEVFGLKYYTRRMLDLCNELRLLIW